LEFDERAFTFEDLVN